MLEVGDKVKIREDLIIDEYYGKEHFVNEMEEYKGKSLTIDYVRKGFYYMEEDGGEWAWTKEMFKDDNKFNIGDKVKWRRIINIGQIEHISNSKDNEFNEPVALVYLASGMYYRIAPLSELQLIPEPKFEVGQKVLWGDTLCEVKWVSDKSADPDKEFEYVLEEKIRNYSSRGAWELNFVSYILVLEGNLKEVE